MSEDLYFIQLHLKSVLQLQMTCCMDLAFLQQFIYAN